MRAVMFDGLHAMNTASPFDCSGATAVVLGGATGLGRAMAEGLAAHGAQVCVVSRSEEKAGRAAAEIAARFGVVCSARAADVADEASVTRLRDACAELFAGGVNVAINCAGINVRNPVERVTLDEWELIQRVNITGAFLFAREMFPLSTRSAQGRAGSSLEARMSPSGPCTTCRRRSTSMRTRISD